MRTRVRCTTQFAAVLLLTMMAAAFPASSPGQAAPVERTFHIAKAQVESALVKLQAAAGGRLPTVDGFVTAQDQPLERFQRAHYTYSIQVSAQPSGSCQVQVKARITAWYADPAPAKAGYRELTSNGRLESDLIERLEELLRPAASEPAPQPSHDSSAITKAMPAQSTGSLFKTPSPGVTALPPRTDAESPVLEPKSSANHVQSLKEQASNLEEILRNQTRPTDLAAVKKSRTPVFARPSEQGDVLFLAEAQDEFQVLNRNSDWVHVQISGLSRGWMRGADLELPSRSTSIVVPGVSTSPGPAPAGNQPFRLSRQEVNTYPGQWAPLRGKSVRILSLEPSGATASTASQKWETARSMFLRAAARLAQHDGSAAKVEGVVLIFDSADGGMVSATLATLQEWNERRISDDAFRAQCSFDPPEAFQESRRP